MWYSEDPLDSRRGRAVRSFLLLPDAEAVFFRFPPVVVEEDGGGGGGGGGDGKTAAAAFASAF